VIVFFKYLLLGKLKTVSACPAQEEKTLSLRDDFQDLLLSSENQMLVFVNGWTPADNLPNSLLGFIHDH